MVCLALAPGILFSQYTKPTRIFGKGQVDIQASVGIFPTYIADKPQSIIPPLQLSVRWMVARPVSLSVFGGYSYSRSRERLVFDSTRFSLYNQSYFLGLENGFHYTRIDNWDLYGGLCLLYQSIRIEADNPDFTRAMANFGIEARKGKLSLTAVVGSRYALSPHYTVFIELGYGVSLLKAGVGYRL
jgi:hypothetical protein